MDVEIGYIDKDRRRPFAVVLCAAPQELSIVLLPEEGAPPAPTSHSHKRKGKPNPQPTALAVADLDDDGLTDDLAVTYGLYEQVSLLFGKAPGLFEWRFKDGNVDKNPCDIAIGRFGETGRPVLAVAHSLAPRISLLVRDDESRYGFLPLAEIEAGRGVRAVDLVSTGDPPVTLVAAASKHGDGHLAAWLVEWDGTVHRIGRFEGDTGLHEVLAGCLSGSDRPFLIGLGHRFHPVPLHLTDEWPGRD